MPADLPKTTVKFLVALLKHQAENLLGKDAAGILGDDVQQKLNDWLNAEKTKKDLWNAAQQAQRYLQDERNCPDKDLRYFFRDVGFGDLPAVQEALAELPQAMDAGGVTDALLQSFRGFSTLSPSQQEEGARLYTEALLRAVATLEPFTLPIIQKVVQDNSKKLDALGIGQAEIKALLEKLILQPSSFHPSPTLPGDLPIGSHLPIQPNPLFTGRERELQQLAELLCPPACSPLPLGEGLGVREDSPLPLGEGAGVREDSPLPLGEGPGVRDGVVLNQQALVGMGGVGKTQLAVQFAWTYGYRFRGVHWVSAYREQASLPADEVIKQSIAACGRAMNLQPWPQDVNQQVEHTLAAWKAAGPRLVILDNLEDLQAAAVWLAKLRHSAIRVLVTSRQQNWSPTFGLREIPLRVFTKDESLAFLRRSLDETRASDADLTELHERLGGLPLPLDLAAAYLKAAEKLSVAAYLEKLRLDHPSLKNWRARYPNATQHDKDVAATFALSWERVEDEAARRLFLLAGYGLPNEPLPQDVLQAAAELDDAAYSDALDLLKGLSLLQPEISLHPLLADFARLQDVERSALFRWARVLAERGYPGKKHGGVFRDPALARYLRLSLPDLRRAAALDDADPQERSSLCFHTAFLLSHFGDLDGAMKLYQQALQIQEGLGDLKGKSATLHEMAYIYRTRGDLDGAMKLYQQALQIQEGLGDLKGKSATLHEMAYIYRTRGDLDGAMKLYQQALQIQEGLGDLKGKSATLHAMANIFVTRGDLDGAMKLYQQSLDIQEGLGDLKGKAMTRGMMSHVLWAKGEKKQAIAFLLGALMQLVELKIEPRTQQAMASDLAGWRNELGAEQFDALWKEITGQENVPEWLAQSALTPGPSPTGRGEQMSVEQFIAAALRAAREKKPEAEAFFKAVSQMAADPAAPPELQALGKALQRLMIGMKDVDLSALPEEWREAIKKNTQT